MSPEDGCNTNLTLVLSSWWELYSLILIICTLPLLIFLAYKLYYEVYVAVWNAVYTFTCRRIIKKFPQFFNEICLTGNHRGEFQANFWDKEHAKEVGEYQKIFPFILWVSHINSNNEIYCRFSLKDYFKWLLTGSKLDANFYKAKAYLDSLDY